MEFKGHEIKTIRQRLGWSMAEMARRMGCDTELVKQWEMSLILPDPDAVNQLCYLLNYVESNADQILRKPLIEREMEERRMAQLTHRDLMKDIQ
jgi:DNA-binding transcriptional regulator YiaG